MHGLVRVRRTIAGMAVALAFGGLVGSVHAQGCGDANGDSAVTVTDGVQVLRTAAGLSSDCTVGRCDVDGNGNVTVTDGVNVLRAAAGLSVNLSCAPQGRFVDNGDGTVTDNKTGLQWEKKTPADDSFDNSTNPHDVDNEYEWCLDSDEDDVCDNPGNPPDGPVFTVFLATLNTPPCFAGHCDWRLPTVGFDGDRAEFETIVDPNAPGCQDAEGVCIDPIFGPTSDYAYYWSATTYSRSPDNAWEVAFFDYGYVDFDYKTYHLRVRAVRGGS